MVSKAIEPQLDRWMSVLRVGDAGHISDLIDRIAWLLTIVGCVLTGSGAAQWQFEGNMSLPWSEVVEEYKELSAQNEWATLNILGLDDGGQPIHLFVLHDGTFCHPDSIRAAGKRILWITNGIHPGEPDGIDASLLLTKALLHSDQYSGLLVNTVVCIVPVYNVSGALNRNGWSRVNQNGPIEYGFRGNALNLDLNRDFIKADTRNTRDLLKALSFWDPDIYFETHVSNGADHQYVMELLTSHPARLDPALRDHLELTLKPALHSWMDRRDVLMCPYFETIDEFPEQGLMGFMDGPRYSSGHSGLCHRIGILSETHMLKPYAERVNATFQLMLATLAVMNDHGEELAEARKQSKDRTAGSASFGFAYDLDTTRIEPIPWKGYRAVHTTSAVTGHMRLRYDQRFPTDTMIPFFDHFEPRFHLSKPGAYIIPRSYRGLIARLELDAVPMEHVKSDMEKVVEVQRIRSYSTVSEPFEGHYLHFDVETEISNVSAGLRVGDVIVPMGYPSDRLVMEILEPRCPDSFFAWGYFDAILQQKEWFSSYVFEDIAAELLEADPELKEALEKERSADRGFAEDPWRQLHWIYQRSPYFEQSYRRYPVLRVP